MRTLNRKQVEDLTKYLKDKQAQAERGDGLNEIEGKLNEGNLMKGNNEYQNFPFPSLLSYNNSLPFPSRGKKEGNGRENFSRENYLHI